MNAEMRRAMGTWLLGLADDELVLGHRDSEWCGHAPILEEDIAFANIALDEIGHARLWYTALARLLGEEVDSYPDRQVFHRPPAQFRNLQLVELPNGDWAFTVLRQYLFDAYEMVLLPGIARSPYRPVADVAAKIATEERYHLRHGRMWVRRLGLGTQESNQRMQTALDALWKYHLQMFTADGNQRALVVEGLLPDIDLAAQEWVDEVNSHLRESGLKVPELLERSIPARSEHTPNLDQIVADLRAVAETDPEADW